MRKNHLVTLQDTADGLHFSGSRNHFTISFEVFETTRAMKGNTFSTAFKNAAQRFVGQTWVRTLYLFILRRILLDSRRSDLKATALLKLIYLEMFGHDMSWASFNVLEVMSSPKYLQKRVGYLGAVQSFRPDTEVLMLATNLLKKVMCGTAVKLAGTKAERLLRISILLRCQPSLYL